MSIEQSGSNNSQHIGDTIHNYYFGTSNRKKSGKLPLRVCRVDTFKSKLISAIPYLAMAAFILYYIAHFPNAIISPLHFIYVSFGAIIVSYAVWYILPIFMPELLLSLYANMIVFDNKKIMFYDIYKIERFENVVRLYFRDSDSVLSLHFSKSKCAEHIYDYYRIAVTAS